MSPERKEQIGSVLVEEYYWAGKLIVYVDHWATDETFDVACRRIRAQHEAKEAKQ